MSTAFLSNWETQARKGLLELCVVNTLRRRRMYGYEIAAVLDEVGGLEAGGGTLYPVLARLKREGLLISTLEESRVGPARKYYTLSAEGEAMCASMNRLWRALAASVDGIAGRRS
ncbi:MAG: PadR family transcriptional regulator [Deltaproteobacteria bacterium]|nr:PadR family transcriptional regulator [Deltaproteobacteria bacterium]